MTYEKDIYIDTQTLFDDSCLQTQLEAFPTEIGEVLAQPQYRDTLANIIESALKTAQTPHEQLAIRNNILGAMIMAGTADYHNTKHYRLHQRLGKPVVPVGKYGMVYSFPSTPIVRDR